MKLKHGQRGFGLTMGFSILYLSLIVLIPLSTIFLKTATLTWTEFWGTLTSPRVFHAITLSFTTSLIAALINTVFGFITAWVLVRYRFFGKKVLDAFIDLPFALPTAVAGISLTAIYAENGIIGRLLEPLGLKIAFASPGIIIALTFIGLPFVVRSVQPVLQELDSRLEEAASTLGATPWKTFSRVIFPRLLPALVTGFALAFSRGLGEYGSVVFISGNIPMKTEIAPFLIMSKLEQFDYAGATSIALLMLLLSFFSLLLINLFQWRLSRRLVQ